MNTDKFAILYDIIFPHLNRNIVNKQLEETENLLKTYGGITLLKVMQRRHHAGSTSYIGKSKYLEIIDTAKTIKANLIVINTTLKASQSYVLKEYIENLKYDIVVWDRVDLILNLFEKHAKTAEAKLQIGLAKIKHYGPSIYGLGSELSNQGGGIGTRGIGETNTEIMKRHLFNKKRLISKKINKLQKSRTLNRQNRQKNGFKTISLIGYTNSGKSSLFRSLTGRNTLVANRLFATLDTVTSKLYLPNVKKNVLLSDTIGFISNLPLHLIDAFKSTLEETIHADLLLHVMDCADEIAKQKYHVVCNILEQLNLAHIPILPVLNKIDLLSSDEIFFPFSNNLSHHHHDVVIKISSKLKMNLPTLLQQIERHLFPELKLVANNPPNNR